METDIEKESMYFTRELMQLGAAELSELKKRTEIEASHLYFKESSEIDNLIEIGSNFGYLPDFEEGIDIEEFPSGFMNVGIYLSLLQKTSKGKKRLFGIRSKNNIPQAFRLRTKEGYSYYQDKTGQMIRLPANVEKPFIPYSQLAKWLEGAFIQINSRKI